MSVWQKLLFSITSTDKYILYVALLELFLYGALWFGTYGSKSLKEKPFSKIHTVFLAILSCFPLLGMFGTVKGLLGLDLATGDMENIKNNFFIALTSTAWGILFSMGYKILHAIIEDDIEIKKSKLKNDNKKH